ncbi:double-strand break repair protein AddB [Yoonia sp. R2331]|uniref:double-strand break repair protein AddB n=1 Tax=Yoonia sp. R2331 TaxID=3237238 RepID=UPI0034E4D251
MFDPIDTPRVFGTPPGADFPVSLVDGLTARADDLARTVVYVNTTRMQRRIRALFDAGPARLLPQVRLVTDLGFEATQAGIPMPVPALRRRLELSTFVAALLDKEPDLAPRSALYDLSDSLANLMEEMHGEGVSPDALSMLDVTDQSGHWQRALQFLNILRPFFDADDRPPDAQARLRRVATQLAARWQDKPPDHPIIVAGSTGSRGATQVFMQAVARLPQGALLLPGFDPDLKTYWSALDDPLTAEDHPQFRYRRLLDGLTMRPEQVGQWINMPDNPRNRLISLSLRPAPVTDAWRAEGPALGDLTLPTKDVTLVEAESPRAEAEAIALRLRQAAQDGQTAALITPDRNLTRQVTAALDRWDITPDDSAGVPLAQTASGRLLRHVADLMGQIATAEALLILLKHPLTHAGEGRNTHLLRTRRLEMRLRRYGPPFLTATDLTDWATGEAEKDPDAVPWAQWIGTILTEAAADEDATLSDHLARHTALAERLSAGSKNDTGPLWDEKAGREARSVCDMIARDADAAGPISIADYRALFGNLLSAGSVRDRDLGHPGILIWGTLEARVGGADLVILGGMNDGTWPETPSPDPWLNRQMRLSAGLLLPERRIGLSAHDYQQAVAGKEVWITRAKRSADAETVPSRWVNRLTNLLAGLPDQNGPDALTAMRARGQDWLAMAAALNAPAADVPRATRPSPRPPVAARPKSLSVTQIKTLIRDPYAIYARKVLHLNKLDPLQPSADAPLRGEIIHKILEVFISERHDARDPAALTRLHDIAVHELELHCPWPAVRLQWLARMEQVAAAFLTDEAARQDAATFKLAEAKGEIGVGQTGVTLTCKADRFDATDDGKALIYDYKTGAVPSKLQQELFDKQLLLEAAMVEQGAFPELGPMPVAGASFLGVSRDTVTTPAPLADYPAREVWTNFVALMQRWQRPDRGYSARLAMFSTTDHSDFDHLSRFGEWDISDDPEPVDLT